jgi:hypothetical protein
LLKAAPTSVILVLLWLDRSTDDAAPAVADLPAT